MPQIELTRNLSCSRSHRVRATGDPAAAAGGIRPSTRDSTAANARRRFSPRQDVAGGVTCASDPALPERGDPVRDLARRGPFRGVTSRTVARGPGERSQAGSPGSSRRCRGSGPDAGLVGARTSANPAPGPRAGGLRRCSPPESAEASPLRPALRRRGPAWLPRPPGAGVLRGESAGRTVRSRGARPWRDGVERGGSGRRGPRSAAHGERRRSAAPSRAAASPTATDGGPRGSTSPAGRAARSAAVTLQQRGLAPEPFSPRTAAICPAEAWHRGAEARASARKPPEAAVDERRPGLRHKGSHAKSGAPIAGRHRADRAAPPARTPSAPARAATSSAAAERVRRAGAPR